jgi:hypothetical protein
MITYESICNKLGFPFDDEKRYEKTEYFEDDSQPNPYLILNSEEMEFVGQYLYRKLYSKESKVA